VLFARHRQRGLPWQLYATKEGAARVRKPNWSFGDITQFACREPLEAQADFDDDHDQDGFTARA
jgi:hypothetical protein